MERINVGDENVQSSIVGFGLPVVESTPTVVVHAQTVVYTLRVLTIVNADSDDYYLKLSEISAKFGLRFSLKRKNFSDANDRNVVYL